MSISKYREFACDVYFKAFYLLRKIFDSRGEQLIFDLFRSYIQNMQEPYVAESGIFAARSILDALDMNELSNQFIQAVYTAIISNPHSITHKVLARGVIVFI